MFVIKENGFVDYFLKPDRIVTKSLERLSKDIDGSVEVVRTFTIISAASSCLFVTFLICFTASSSANVSVRMKLLDTLKPRS